MDTYYKYLDEASYKNNLGFEEMARFYQNASNEEIEEMEKVLKDEDWKKFKELIKKVLKIQLI